MNKIQWVATKCADGVTKHEWNGYTVVSVQNAPFRWMVVQGNPAPHRSTFRYLNDAKEACEVRGS